MCKPETHEVVAKLLLNESRRLRRDKRTGVEWVRQSLRWILPLVMIASAGCSQQEFARPFPRVSSHQIPQALISGTADGAGKTRSKKLAEVLARWETESGSSWDRDYEVGPGDVLQIAIAALESPDRTSALSREISQEGVISLPFVGDVHCSGLTTGKIEAQLKSLYGKSYIRDPQVNVSVGEYKSRRVVVVGAVERPGVYILPRNGSTVLALLAQAGGVTKEAGDDLAIVRPSRDDNGSEAENQQVAVSEPPSSRADREPIASRADSPAQVDSAETGSSIARKQREIKVNLGELVDEGDLSLNVEVRNGDMISVSRKDIGYVCVLGYVRSPAAFPLAGGESMSILRALSLAGGLTPSSRAENSILIRQTETGQKSYPIDLTEVVRGEGPALHLKSGDTVIVGSDALAKFMEIFQPRVGASAGYSVGP